MIKPFVPKFRRDLSSPLKDIAEKLLPAKLKPIVGARIMFSKQQVRRYKI